MIAPLVTNRPLSQPVMAKVTVASEPATARDLLDLGGPTSSEYPWFAKITTATVFGLGGGVIGTGAGAAIGAWRGAHAGAVVGVAGAIAGAGVGCMVGMVAGATFGWVTAK